MLSGGARCSVAADELRTFRVQFPQLSLQPVPRAVLRVVVVAAGQIAQAVAVRPPSTSSPLVELLELPSLDAVGREGRHAAPPRGGGCKRLLAASGAGAISCRVKD